MSQNVHCGQKKHVVSIISAIVFIVIALLHLARGIYGWQLSCHGHEVPTWVSWLVFAIFGLLGAWNLCCCCCKKCAKGECSEHKHCHTNQNNNQFK